MKLRDVVDAIDALFENHLAYLNRKTGEIVTLSEEERRLIDQEDDDEDVEQMPEWELELLPKIHEVIDSPDYLELPDKFELHEWEMMERFCQGVAEAAQRTELLGALEGSGAFRTFRAAANRLGLRDRWEAFRADAIAEIARTWLDEHGISYDA